MGLSGLMLSKELRENMSRKPSASLWRRWCLDGTVKNRATKLFIRKNWVALSWQRPILLSFLYYGGVMRVLWPFPANSDAGGDFENSFMFAETEMPRMVPGLCFHLSGDYAAAVLPLVLVISASASSQSST